MAYSSSIKCAQVIKLCELCQDDPTKWRCIDCTNMCLCEKCKTSHMKIPVTAKHQIITIGTSLQDIQKKFVIDKIPCKNHPKKMTYLFCRSCNFLICPDCVSTNHKKHNFVPIDSVLDEKLDYIRSIHDKIDANVKCCESKISEVQNAKSKFDAAFDKSLRNIKQKEQALINAIRKYSKELQEKIENERSKVSKTLLKFEKDVDNTKKNLHKQREELDAILRSNQGSLIFKAGMEIKDLKFDSLPNQIEQLTGIHITESTKKIKELFGSWKKLSIPTTDNIPEMDFEVIKTFTTDLPFIDRVITLGETSAWINCYTQGVVRKVKIEDNNIITTQEVSLKVYDMAVISNNELLLSMNNGSEVKLLKQCGKITSFLTVAPLIPCGICVTKDNDVIVGVKEFAPGTQYTPTDKSQRAVIVYGKDGKQIHKFQYDKDGQRLFTFVDRITTNINQNIIVLDTTSGYNGRVVVLNKGGNLRWFYEGHFKFNASKQFDPRGIVTTLVGHVIISDGSVNGLHVLSEDGDILACKVMTEIGIKWPMALHFDSKERVWAGCHAPKDKTDAKIHIIKLLS